MKNLFALLGIVALSAACSTTSSGGGGNTGGGNTGGGNTDGGNTDGGNTGGGTAVPGCTQWDGSFVSDGGPLTVGTTCLNNAKVGDVYSFKLYASGGTPPYTWSFSTPDGGSTQWLTLVPNTGELTGTPAKKSTDGIALTVRVSDAAGGTTGAVSKNLTLKVDGCKDGDSTTCVSVVNGITCSAGKSTCVDGNVADNCAGAGLAFFPSVESSKCSDTCGTCFPGGNACLAGACKCGVIDNCKNGEYCCGAACINIMNDPSHCGSCGNNCGAKSCVVGVCK